MYTDEDLDNAVSKGIFTNSSVEQFRNFVSESKHSSAADEENFRLIASFNDIFVVIACMLVLFSSAWVAQNFNSSLAMGAIALLSWGFAEFFVLKRKMALPAIFLLISFVGGVFAFSVSLFDSPSEKVLMISAAFASFSAWIHWKRFNVPITVAAGTATVMVFGIYLLITVFPNIKDYFLYLVFIGGVITFAIAMVWDSKDLSRVTQKSDVAFWLHLVSAPLIVHPVFSLLGILEGDQSLTSVIIVMTLYIFLTLVSLTIDRRAFMVSSLIYVLYALSSLLNTYGIAGDKLAYVGMLIGFSLLLLSGFWHRVRKKLVGYLPKYVRDTVPSIV